MLLGLLVEEECIPRVVPISVETIIHPLFRDRWSLRMIAVPNKPAKKKR